MSDGPEWFAPKRYGYGPGVPISWQGWALVAGYVALLGCASFLVPRTWIGYASVVAMLQIITPRAMSGGRARRSPSVPKSGEISV